MQWGRKLGEPEDKDGKHKGLEGKFREKASEDSFRQVYLSDMEEVQAVDSRFRIKRQRKLTPIMISGVCNSPPGRYNIIIMKSK